MGAIDVGINSRVKEIPAGQTWQINTSKTTLYGLEDGKLSKWGETHFVTLNEHRNSLAIESSYGDFSFCWIDGAFAGRTFKEFLAGLSFDYLMGKLTSGQVMIVNVAKTIEGMKAEVLADRKEGRMDKEKAREAYEELSLIDEGIDERDLWGEIHRSDALGHFSGNIEMKWERRHELLSIWEEVWIPFRDQVLS